MIAEQAIPCRASNPFATCWTRPGALPFVDTWDTGIEACLAKLRRSRWRGQILGPHGAGKTTLLRAIGHAAEREGHSVCWLGGNAGAAWPENGTALRPQRTLALFDGFDQLPAWRRWLWRCRPSGLIVTTHKPAGLPTLAQLRPSLAAAEALFDRLTAGANTPVTRDDLILSWRRRRGNLRDAWFDLYNLHEQLLRQQTNRGADHP